MTRRQVDGPRSALRNERRRSRRVAPVLAGFALLLGGCAGTQRGQIYSMKDGRSSVVVAEHPCSSGGALRASLPSGESCQGSFSEVAVPDVQRLGKGAGTVPLSANSEASIAVLNCGESHVLRCTLARRSTEGFSYGACKDEGGNEFSLLF